MTRVIQAYAKQLSSHFGKTEVELAVSNTIVISTQQGNSYDCGCYTIWNLIRYIQRKSFTELPADFRPRLALWILTQDHGVFFPEFKYGDDAVIITDESNDA
jgi:hypothetical protein